MKNKKYALDFMLILIVSIIALVAITVAATLITSQTSVFTITEDPVTGSNTSCVDVTEKCILTITSIEAGAVTVNAGNYSTCSVNAGSTRYDDGILVGDDYNAASLNVSYTEIECNYLTGLTAVAIRNITVLMGIALLVFVAGFAIMKK